MTNTTRFYNQNEIAEENCKYLKLQCRGHGETPSPEQTRTFVSICHNFITQNPLSVIGVHCTHGFNRSGFLIVSYLVEKMDCAIEIALSEFVRVRPPGIYKQDYLDELYRRYDDVNETPPAPILPDWCNEAENGTDRDEPEPEAANCSTEPPRRRNGKLPVFMEGVPGVEPFLEQPKAFNLQRKVQRMCGWKSNKGFPGCQPVSMDCQNINLLHQKPYRVSWKADGTRCVFESYRRSK